MNQEYNDPVEFILDNVGKIEIPKDKDYDFTAFVEECAGTVEIPKQPNTISDKQLLDLIFSVNGINMVLTELEPKIQELGQSGKRLFYKDILVLKYYLTDIFKVLSSYNFTEMTQDERNEYVRQKSENIVKEAKETINKGIQIKAVNN